MLYDESYQVRDGDNIQTPKHGSSSAVQNRISIKSTPAVVLKQKSATEVGKHSQQSSAEGIKKQNSKSEYLKRPSTCLNGLNNNNGREHYENLTGLTRTLETSRATYRVGGGSSSVGMSAAAVSFNGIKSKISTSIFHSAFRVTFFLHAGTPSFP